MKRTDKIRLICYFAALGAILFYPVQTICRFTFPREKGTEYRIPVTAYDPYDPMRGRYVQLNLNEAGRVRLPHKNLNLFQRRKSCFAVLSKTPDGKFKIADIEEERGKIPAGQNFLPVRYLWFDKDYDRKKKKYLKSGTHYIKLPFERFYLNEKKAPEVEQLLRNRKNKAELVIQVYPDGIYQVKALTVNGKSVRGR